MSYEKEGKENLQEQDQEHKIRITITSKNCSAIERISNELVKAAKDKNLKVSASSQSDKLTTRVAIKSFHSSEHSRIRLLDSILEARFRAENT